MTISAAVLSNSSSSSSSNNNSNTSNHNTNTTNSSSPRLLSSDESNPQQGAMAKEAVPPSHVVAFKIPPTEKDSRKLFVGGLPIDITSDEFTSFFGQFGTIAHSAVIFDHVTSRSRGFGFVTFVNEDDAVKVLAMGDNNDSQVGHVQMRDKMVEIKPAKPKQKVSVNAMPRTFQQQHQHQQQQQHLYQYYAEMYTQQQQQQQQHQHHLQHHPPVPPTPHTSNHPHYAATTAAAASTNDYYQHYYMMNPLSTTTDLYYSLPPASYPYHPQQVLYQQPQHQQQHPSALLYTGIADAADHNSGGGYHQSLHLNTAPSSSTSSFDPYNGSDNMTKPDQ